MNNVKEAHFEAAVLLPSFQIPVVVLFSAVWCGPCQAYKPQIARLSDDQGFRLVGVDVSEEKALAGFYGVRSVPTLAVFKDGKVAGMKLGAATEPVVRDFLTLHGVMGGAQ